MTQETQKYWLIKSEPHTWSFDQQRAVKIEPWDGVRNYQARNFLKMMNVNDLCFFYHSVKEKRIVGIVRVVSEYKPDSTDSTGTFGLRDMGCVKDLTHPVTLEDIKKIRSLENMILLKQSRLSVQPVSPDEWETILNLSGTKL